MAEESTLFVINLACRFNYYNEGKFRIPQWTVMVMMMMMMHKYYYCYDCYYCSRAAVTLSLNTMCSTIMIYTSLHTNTLKISTLLCSLSSGWVCVCVCVLAPLVFCVCEHVDFSYTQFVPSINDMNVHSKTLKHIEQCMHQMMGDIFTVIALFYCIDCSSCNSAN